MGERWGGWGGGAALSKNMRAVYKPYFEEVKDLVRQFTARSCGQKQINLKSWHGKPMMHHHHRRVQKKGQNRPRHSSLPIPTRLPKSKKNMKPYRRNKKQNKLTGDDRSPSCTRMHACIHPLITAHSARLCHLSPVALFHPRERPDDFFAANFTPRLHKSRKRLSQK